MVLKIIANFGFQILLIGIGFCLLYPFFFHFFSFIIQLLIILSLSTETAFTFSYPQPSHSPPTHSLHILVNCIQLLIILFTIFFNSFYFINELILTKKPKPIMCIRFSCGIWKCLQFQAFSKMVQSWKLTNGSSTTSNWYKVSEKTRGWLYYTLNGLTQITF